MNIALNRFIGRKIHDARKAQKLTQRDLAKAVNLTAASISNIELGTQSIQLEHLYKIASILKKEIVDLLPTVKILHDQASLDQAVKKLPNAERSIVASLRARMSEGKED